MKIKAEISRFHNNLLASRQRESAIESKRHEISGVEGLLQTYEELPEDKRDYDYERHLRAKLRAKKNQLIAMAPI